MISRLIAILLCCSLVHGATYYVAKTGNDTTGTGTEALPWLTIRKAADTIVDGDTVLIKAGTYNEVYPSSIVEGVIIRRNDVTFANYGSDVVTVSSPTAAYSFTANGKSGITLRGLNITGSANVGVWLTSVTNSVLTNLTIYSNASDGIYISHYCRNITVTGCTARNNGASRSFRFGITTIGDSPDLNAYPAGIVITNCTTHNNDGSGIWVFKTRDTIVVNSTTFSNGATGIQIEAGCSDIVVRGNTAMRNGWLLEGQETGIWVDETSRYLVEDNITYENQKGYLTGQSYFGIIRNNRSYSNRAQYTVVNSAYYRNSHGLGFGQGSEPAGSHITQPRGFSTNYFAHNTFYADGHPESIGGGYYVYNNNAATRHNKWVNNIISSASTKEVYSNDTDPWLISDYNIFYHPSRNLSFQWGLADWGWSAYRNGTGLDANSITSDPLFVNAGAADFSLDDGSPAIDAGGWLTTVTSTATGTAMPVADPYWFYDGWGITGETPDTIQLASGGSAVISSINYGTKIITLATPLSWTSGEGVAYAYTGNRPDIGAVERTTTPDPTQVMLTTPTGTALMEQGPGTQTIALNRTGPLDADLPVDISIGGTATPAQHFIALSDVWTLAAGSSSTNITVTAIDDGIYSGGLTITFAVDPAVGYSVAGTPITLNRIDAQVNPALTTGRDPSGQSFTPGRLR